MSKQIKQMQMDELKQTFHNVRDMVMMTVVGLLVLRVVLARPVPEVIPDRALMLGCVLGLATFLAGNFVAAHVTRILP